MSNQSWFQVKIRKIQLYLAQRRRDNPSLPQLRGKKIVNKTRMSRSLAKVRTPLKTKKRKKVRPKKKERKD